MLQLRPASQVCLPSLTRTHTLTSPDWRKSSSWRVKVWGVTLWTRANTSPSLGDVKVLFTLETCPTAEYIRSRSLVSPAEGVRAQWQRTQLTTIRVCAVIVSGRLLSIITLLMHRLSKRRTWLPNCANLPVTLGTYPETLLSTRNWISSFTSQHKDELK